MAQVADYNIANANGATVRADLNAVFLAVSSTNSGTSEPSTMYAFMLWVDTTTNLIKLRNAANNAWITLGLSVTASNTVDINGGAIDGTAIGASSATTGAFTTLTTTDNLSIGGSNKELRFYEASNYVGFEAPALTGDQIWVLPIEDGDADQVLATNGSGTLSFATVSGTTINNNADNRIITGSGTANTLNGEAALTWNGSTFSADGGAVFNDSSADVDFRIETNGNENTFFVNGDKDYVSIGTASDFAAGSSVLHLDQPDAGSNCYLHMTQGDSGATTSDGMSIGVLDGGLDATIRLRENGNLIFRTNNLERMRINAAGKMGLGTDSPQKMLQIYQAEGGVGVKHAAIRLSGFGTVGADISAYRVDGNSNNQGLILSVNDATAGSVDVLTLDNAGAATFSGAVSKASGSFRISHPLPSLSDTHDLVHSFIEGPQADLLYRGTVDLIGGSATVNIDTEANMTEGTFVLLCDDIQCFTSNESNWDAIKGSVSGNILTITCENSSSDATVSWLVIGERQDEHMIDTEWTDSEGKVIVEPKKVIEE